MRFNEIVGNEVAKNILLKTIKSKNLLNSYLFVGQEGIGKKEIAIEFARMILCESEDFENDESCSSCIKFNSNNHPDFNLLERDGNIIGIAQIRDIVEDVYQKPIHSNRKIIIIDDAEYMTEEAQNAFLKTLEEPPGYITIILITSREDMLLSTILSRCTKVQFQGIKEDEIIKYIDDNIDKFNNNIKELSYLANGSIGRLYDINENNQVISEIKNNINKLITNYNYSKIDFIKENEILYSSKDNIINLLDYIIVILFEQLKVNYSLSDCIANSIKYVENAKTRIKSNCNYDMTIDEMLFKMWEEFNEKYSRR